MQIVKNLTRGMVQCTYMVLGDMEKRERHLLGCKESCLTYIMNKFMRLNDDVSENPM